jgi:hypothetical protein
MLKSFSFGRDKSANSKSDEDRLLAERFAIQRELLRIAVKDTLRAQGMQATWVGCELIAAGTDESGPKISLVVQEWQEDLMRYLPALQTQILVALNTLDTSLHAQAQGVSWQFAVNCGCPHHQLPNTSFWQATSGVQALQAARQADGTNPAGQSPDSPVSVKKKFDLPTSDMDRLHATDWDAIPSTYAATQPGFLATQPAGIDPAKS